MIPTLATSFIKMAVFLCSYVRTSTFDLHIVVNFPFLCSNTLPDPSYGVYISQLQNYTQCCLMISGIATGALKLENFFKKFYGRYQDLIKKYQRSAKVIVMASFLGCSRNLVFVQFGGHLFCQITGIPMGTNCAPLLSGLLLNPYENDFLDNMIRSSHMRLAR